jgi:hypothetical protein
MFIHKTLIFSLSPRLVLIVIFFFFPVHVVIAKKLPPSTVTHVQEVKQGCAQPTHYRVLFNNVHGGSLEACSKDLCEATYRVLFFSKAPLCLFRAG